jgi:uncharacterized protein YndB with AHSA1/START domain
MATPSLHRVVASITIRAAPDAVFDAWLDPRLARRFLAANTTVVGTFENDPREGGSFRLTMQGEGDPVLHEGRYVLIDRPHRLVFTWISAGVDWRLSLVSVTFTPDGDGVRVDLEHEGIPDAERADRHRSGWRSILQKLSQLDL